MADPRGGLTLDAINRALAKKEQEEAIQAGGAPALPGGSPVTAMPADNNLLAAIDRAIAKKEQEESPLTSGRVALGNNPLNPRTDLPVDERKLLGAYSAIEQNQNREEQWRKENDPRFMNPAESVGDVAMEFVRGGLEGVGNLGKLGFKAGEWALTKGPGTVGSLVTDPVGTLSKGAQNVKEAYDQMSNEDLQKTGASTALGLAALPFSPMASAVAAGLGPTVVEVGRQMLGIDPTSATDTARELGANLSSSVVATKGLDMVGKGIKGIPKAVQSLKGSFSDQAISSLGRAIGITPTSIAETAKQLSSGGRAGGVVNKGGGIFVEVVDDAGAPSLLPADAATFSIIESKLKKIAPEIADISNSPKLAAPVIGAGKQAAGQRLSDLRKGVSVALKEMGSKLGAPVRIKLDFSSLYDYAKKLGVSDKRLGRAVREKVRQMEKAWESTPRSFSSLNRFATSLTEGERLYKLSGAKASSGISGELKRRARSLVSEQENKIFQQIIKNKDKKISRFVDTDAGAFEVGPEGSLEDFSNRLDEGPGKTTPTTDDQVSGRSSASYDQRKKLNIQQEETFSLSDFLKDKDISPGDLLNQKERFSAYATVEPFILKAAGQEGVRGPLGAFVPQNWSEYAAAASVPGAALFGAPTIVTAPLMAAGATSIAARRYPATAFRTAAAGARGLGSVASLLEKKPISQLLRGAGTTVQGAAIPATQEMQQRQRERMRR